MELTPKQARVLDFIRRHAAANGIPPTRAAVLGRPAAAAVE